jgi:Uma2 family endonuclease
LATPSWPRYELIDGELLVTPSPGISHQIAVAQLLLLIAPYVNQQGLGITIPAPSDVELREGSITQPDVYVLPAGPVADEKGLARSQARQLVLAVEVLSPANLRTDRIIKRDFYMESGVAEYWIVDLESRLFERWVPTSPTPDVEQAVMSWRPAGSAAALAIDIPAYFASVEQQAAWARKALELP